MFRRILTLAAAASIVGVSQTRADDKLVLPKTAPPKFVTVNEFDLKNEQITVAVVDSRNVSEIRTREVVVNRQKMKEQYAVVVPVAVTHMEIRSIKGAKFQNGAGKTLDKASAIQMFKHGTVILWADAPAGVDPLYLKALGKDTLVVIQDPPPEPPLP